MTNSKLNTQLAAELQSRLEQGLASGDLPTEGRVSQATSLFRDRFGPEVLAKTDGEALLRLMHGRDNTESALPHVLAGIQER